MTENPSIVSHLSLGTNRFEESVAFYEKVFATLGCKKLMQHEGAAAFGKLFPEFWIQSPIDGMPASVGNGTHIGFIANSQKEVHDFFRVALEAGATSEGDPGPRQAYGPEYYGCFVRDLDGHKIEATFWDFSKSES